MKKLFLFMVLPGFILAKSLILSPNKDLSLEDLAFVAQGGKVDLSPLALSNIEAGFKVLLDAVLEGKNIYGLSVGVGWNKDRAVFNIKNGQKTIDEDLIKLSKQFNKISLRAHALGLGEPLDPKIVRMAMLQRLYTATKGQAGISPDLAKRYVEFLNLNITPVVPSFGSVGEADITLAAHIGLAMMGEYKVWYKGKIMNSGEVLKLAKLKPLEPVAKDFLSILSNNTLMNAYLVLELEKLEKILSWQDKLYILMLEGFNGNIAPFSELALKARGFEYITESSKTLNACLEGSYLLKDHPDRALQDPLSFRTQIYAIAQAKNSLRELKQDLLIAINHSDDNPLVLIKANKSDKLSMDNHFINKDQAIIPSANFEYLPISARVENLNLALARLAENITQSLLRFSDPQFTKLPKFLIHPDNKGHGFGAIEKPIVVLNENIKNLSQAQSVKSVSLAGNVEDMATFSNLSILNLSGILKSLIYLQSFELMYATQAIDLRKETDSLFALGKCSKNIYTAYRKIVPFFKEDRICSIELEKGYDFLNH